jgi:hypothetical protein
MDVYNNKAVAPSSLSSCLIPRSNLGKQKANFGNKQYNKQYKAVQQKPQTKEEDGG